MKAQALLRAAAAATLFGAAWVLPAVHGSILEPPEGKAPQPVAPGRGQPSPREDNPLRPGLDPETEERLSAPQSSREIRGPALCQRECFQVEHVGRVGAESGPGMLPGFSRFARDGTGRLFVSAFEAPGEILVYDRNGRFERSFGREGQGPGEFRNVSWMVVVPGDSLHVFDHGNSRRSVFSPGLGYVRSSRVTGLTITDAIAVSGGRIVASGRLSTAASVGLPFHVIEPEGGVVRSFGADPSALYLPQLDRSLERRLARGGADRFWSANRTEYLLQEWDADGQLHREIRRVADWFPPYSEITRIGPEQPPSPSVNSIHMDSRGRLWVITAVPEKDFSKHIERRMTAEGISWIPRSREAVFASMVEVIDPRENRLVASQFFSTMFGALLDDSTAVSVAENEVGVPRLELWRIVLNAEGGH